MQVTGFTQVSHGLNTMQDLGTSYAVQAQSRQTLLSRAFLLICVHEHVTTYDWSPFEVASYLFAIEVFSLHCLID